MKLKVSRTSQFNHGVPCDEAYIEGVDSFNKPIYWVEINTLKELMAFIEKYGVIVLDKDEIEIYDDYRE